MGKVGNLVQFFEETIEKVSSVKFDSREFSVS